MPGAKARSPPSEARNGLDEITPQPCLAFEASPRQPPLAPTLPLQT